MNKIKISELPLYSSIKGLFTIGTDSQNKSVKVSLESEFAKKQDKLSASNPVTREMVAQGAVSTSKMAGLSVTRSKLAKEVTDELEGKADVIFLDQLSAQELKDLASYIVNEGELGKYSKTIFMYEGLPCVLKDADTPLFVQMMTNTSFVFEPESSVSYGVIEITINPQAGTLSQTSTFVGGTVFLNFRGTVTQQGQAIAVNKAQASACRQCGCILRTNDGQFRQIQCRNEMGHGLAEFIGWYEGSYQLVRIQIMFEDEEMTEGTQTIMTENITI